MGWKMFFKFPENLSRQCIGSDHFLVKYRKNQTVYFFPFTHTLQVHSPPVRFFTWAHHFFKFSHQFFIILTRFLFFFFLLLGWKCFSFSTKFYKLFMKEEEEMKEFFEISTHSIYTKTWTNCCRKRSYSKNFTASRQAICHDES